VADEEIGVLVLRAVIGVGVEDELRVREVLLCWVIGIPSGGDAQADMRSG